MNSQPPSKAALVVSYKLHFEIFFSMTLSKLNRGIQIWFYYRAGIF